MDRTLYLALGPMVREAIAIAEKLEDEDGLSCGVVNARFVSPSTGHC